MLDIGWTELLIIGIVALIVVGPKDLPVMFRTLGRFTGRLRAMARDFSRAMDEAADQSGARDIARDLRTMSNPRSAGTKAFKKASGLDDFDDPVGDDEDAQATESAEGDRKATRGPNTAALTEQRAEEARAQRAEAARRANERAAAFRGFDAPDDGTTSPAPTPGEAAPDTGDTVGAGDGPDDGAAAPEPRRNEA
jgi:sec-independent protein translocase protein TatB